MSTNILETTDGKAVLYCTTEQWAFGPVFDSLEQAKEFLEGFMADTDPRTLPKIQLENCFNEYISCGEWDSARPERVAARDKAVKALA